ncbi:hypothetical protein K7W42_08095 [Deinococcus sp. HMF7604]|uniref:hypothetical protein n=1 Tax=Deinococcus betulae TaxID=2873312 RepID=UPI001CC9A104|nr:hypothetical protein [Deinococcus betulae]MBZ9750822.1 hypothetical protein [Deinococcus betulae]
MSSFSFLALSWVPGTMDRVQFTTAGRRYTVLLRHIEQTTVHAVSDLYLKGRVILQVSAEHHAQLMGTLALQVRAVPA